MRAALDHHLEEDLEVSAEMLVEQAGGVAWRTAAEQDLGYDAGPQRWVEVYDRSGAPLHFRGPPVRQDIRAALPSPLAETEEYRTVRTPAGAFTRILTAARRVGSLPVRLRVARSEDGLRADLRHLIVILAVMAPLAVTGAALAGYVISGRALAPLIRMAEQARSISADRLNERLPVALDWSSFNPVGFSVAYDRREKTGNRSGFGPIGDRPPRSLNIQLAEPVDYLTNEITLAAEHDGGTFQVRGEYFYSDFANGIDTLRWENVWASGAAGADYDVWDRLVATTGARHVAHASDSDGGSTPWRHQARSDDCAPVDTPCAGTACSGPAREAAPAPRRPTWTPRRPVGQRRPGTRGC